MAPLVLVAIVFASVVSETGTAPARSGAGAAPDQQRFSALKLLLRLHDLPLGYRVLDFGPSPEFHVQPLTCDAVHPANQQPRLADFLDSHSLTGCYATYFRIFHVPGAKPASLAVGSGAMNVGSAEAAEAALAVAPELISHLIDDEVPEEAPSPTIVGDGARLFHWSHPALFKESERPDSSFLVWRSKDVVAAIFVTGANSSAANDRAASELALLQQRHIEAPTPYTPAELDSSEVALEDPELGST